MTEHDESTATILVIDDNPENRALARMALEDEGFAVELASSGPEGVAAFAARTPDCVLLDVRMPEMDGFTACERLRALPGGAEVPILFVTALRDVETFDRVLRAGGADFLTKPFRPTELVVRVQTALRLRRMDAELREQVELVRRQRDDVTRLQLQKEQLTAFIVHDLKNPVHAIDLHAQLLLRRCESPAAVAASARQIRDEARALMRLIYNLLDVHRGEEGRLTPRTAVFDLGELVGQILEAFEVRAAADQVRLVAEVGQLPLRADHDLFRRVLENLIDNAIRHSPEGGTVRVAARAGEDGVEVRVVDAGSGVAPELRARVFEPFVQLEAEGPRSTRGGRGLGLTFCRLAVEAHGGRIWIEDGAPGAAFCVLLPQERA